MVTIWLLFLFSQPQIGSYFGAEVCVVDLNRDSNTDLLLVSAPTYIESDREGLVFVYTFTRRVSVYLKIQLRLTFLKKVNQVRVNKCTFVSV